MTTIGRSIVITGELASTEDILVVDQGRISAEGTHEQLVKSCDLYSRLASQLVAPPVEQPAPEAVAARRLALVI